MNRNQGIDPSGPRKTTVPNIVGQTRANAITALGNAGLNLGSESTTNTSNSGLDTQVISQGVASGTVVLRGSSVNISRYNYVYPGFGFYSFFFFYGGFGFYPGFFSTFGFGHDYSVAPDTMVRTPQGLVRAEDIQVGDTLYSLALDELGENADEVLLPLLSGGAGWSSDNFTPLGLVETTVTSIGRAPVSELYVVNGDLFSPSHYILIKRGDVYQMSRADSLEASDLVYDGSVNDWEPISTYESVGLSSGVEVVSIRCEPYDLFFTEHMLTWNGLSPA